MTLYQFIWIVTIVIVAVAVGYFIWFTIWWNKMEREKYEIMRIYYENQRKILRKKLSEKNSKDKM